MITGSLVAIVTPMNEDGSIHWDSLARLIAMHIENDTQAIVSVGTTGESTTLSMAEHKQVIEFTIKEVKGRIPVIAGTGSNSTTEAIELTRSAAAAGAELSLSVVPYYNKPSQEGLYQHFKTIVDQTGMPTLLYNVPGRTVADLLPETVLRLAELEHIVGIKEATGDISRVATIKAGTDKDFALYSGDDASCRDFLLAGGHGVISVTSNLVPRQMQAMCQAALSGDAALAASLDQSLLGLHTDLFVDANPVPVKWALQRMGLIPGGIRLPLVPLAEKHHAQVEAAMLKAGIEL